MKRLFPIVLPLLFTPMTAMAEWFYLDTYMIEYMNVPSDTVEVRLYSDDGTKLAEYFFRKDVTEVSTEYTGSHYRSFQPLEYADRFINLLRSEGPFYFSAQNFGSTGYHLRVSTANHEPVGEGDADSDAGT
ncbi:MAG TPA: hypothetical protein VF275_11455 [Gammaproteobacteria bacterium]